MVARTAHSPSERVIVGVSEIIENLTPATTAIPDEREFYWAERRTLAEVVAAGDTRRFLWSLEQTGSFDPSHDLHGYRPLSITINRDLHVLYYVSDYPERDYGGIHQDARIIARGIENAVGQANANIQSLGGVECVQAIYADENGYSIEPDPDSEEPRGLILTIPVRIQWRESTA